MVIAILLHLSFAQDLGQELANGDRIRMFRPKQFLTDAQCPLAKRLRLYIATLSKGKFGRVVESFSGRVVLWSTRFFNESQGSLSKRLGLLIVSLFIREFCQQIEVVGNEGVPMLQDSFTGCQSLLQKLLGLLILALL